MDRPKVNFDQLTILLLIGDGEMRGFKISQAIGDLTTCAAAFNLGWTMYTLNGLEKMGCLKSRLDGATPERGGNRDRFYSVTTS